MSPRLQGDGGPTAPARPGASPQWVANCYHESWGPVTGLFVPELLDAVGVAAGSRLLDLACGSGVVAAAATGRGVFTLGLDASIGMARTSRHRVAGARFAAGDASRLPLRSARFEGAAINFGVHHFADPDRALRDVARVLEPGGRLAYTAWAAAEENPALGQLNAIYECELGDAKDTFRDADFAFGDRRRYQVELAGVGFDPETASLTAVTHHWRPPSGDAVFLAELRGGGRKSELLASVGEARRRTIRDAVCEVARKFEGVNGIAIPITAYVIAAGRQGTNL